MRSRVQLCKMSADQAVFSAAGVIYFLALSCDFVFALSTKQSEFVLVSFLFMKDHDLE